MASRREFLRRGTGLIGAAGVSSFLNRIGLTSAFAQSATDYKAMVCIFLFGGNDANNLVIPASNGTAQVHTYNAYSKIRGGLAQSLSSLAPTTFNSSQGIFAFNTSCPDLTKLYNNKQLAVAANIGTLVGPTTRAQYLGSQVQLPAHLFSHPDQQLEQQTDGLTGSGSSTGWAGRVADLLSSYNTPGVPTVVSVAGNSIFGTGISTRPATIIPGAALGIQNADAPDLTSLMNLLGSPNGMTLIQSVTDDLRNGANYQNTVKAVLAAAPPLKTTFTANGLGPQLQQVAKLIQARSSFGASRQIFFCSMGGFDTHSAQLADQNPLLGQLNDGLRDFANALTEMNVMNAVTSFTLSDFGRTLQVNTNAGSDHGWGNHHIVMGGALTAPDIYGTFPTHLLGVGDDVGNGRWLPSTSIDQYGATFATWMGVNATDMPKVFPNLSAFPTAKMPFLG